MFDFGFILFAQASKFEYIVWFTTCHCER